MTNQTKTVLIEVQVPEGFYSGDITCVDANWVDVDWSVLPAAEQPAPAVEPPRFFMKHGLWHDRVTGQHMYTQDQYDEGRRDAVEIERIERREAIEPAETPEQITVEGEAERLAPAINRLEQWAMSLSYNDSYVGEPAGEIKRQIRELSHLLDQIRRERITAPAHPEPSRDTQSKSYPFLPCPICNGVEGCDHTVPERMRASATEPARAVPDEMILVSRADLKAAISIYPGPPENDNQRACYKFREMLLATPQPPIKTPDINAMVDRFLGWKLPEDFAPDCGINFKRNYESVSGVNVRQYGDNWWPTGTNLLHAGQARAMIEYMLATPPATKEGE